MYFSHKHPLLFQDFFPFVYRSFVSSLINFDCTFGFFDYIIPLFVSGFHTFLSGSSTTPDFIFPVIFSTKFDSRFPLLLPRSDPITL